MWLSPQCQTDFQINKLLRGIPQEELEIFAWKRGCLGLSAGCCHSAPDLDKQLENNACMDDYNPVYRHFQLTLDEVVFVLL